MQLGFGWTNGIIMDLLDRYHDELTAEDPPPAPPKAQAEGPKVSASSSNFGQISAALIALMISLTAGFIG
jgi:alpha,alpha-trehalase